MMVPAFFDAGVAIFLKRQLQPFQQVISYIQPSGQLAVDAAQTVQAALGLGQGAPAA